VNLLGYVVLRFRHRNPINPGTGGSRPSLAALHRTAGLLAVGLALAGLSGCGGGGGPAAEQSVVTPPPVQQATVVATYHNDNSRSGVNANEMTLTPANVNVASFGKVAAVPVEGEVYAQPLYIANVMMPDGHSHNLVIVATEHDQVYAIDADSKAVLWQKSFLDQQGLITPVPAADTNCHAIANEVGITGTPVIDRTTGAIYLVVRTKETSNGQSAYYQRMHALLLTSGQDMAPATTIVTPANRNGQFGVAIFDPLLNMQRAALLLVNGNVYVTWASHCDLGGYSGWLMSFDATTLATVAAWTPTPSGVRGGIWMSGAGPASDASGDIYVAVGNGWSDAPVGGANFGSALVRLQPIDNAITVSDYFMPWDFGTLNNDDLDLGASGPVLLPRQANQAHQNLMTIAGKDGTVYLLDRDDLGKWQANNDGQILQSFPMSHGEFSTPAFWNNTLYYAVTQDALKAYAFDPTTQQINPTPTSSSGAVRFGWPGATPVISANGTENAIAWTLQTDRYWMENGYSVLRAFDATNLSQELYDTEMSLDRDHPGVAVKFTVPTVADGQVFVGTHNELDVYGLLAH